MGDRYWKNRTYRTIAERMIRTEPIFENLRDYPIKIGYISCSKAKTKQNKIIHAECIKVKPEYRWMIPYDFMIVVYEPNVAHMNDEQIRILLQHELQHIGIDFEGTEPRLYIVPHDIEDFENILRDHGLNWSE